MTTFLRFFILALVLTGCGRQPSSSHSSPSTKSSSSLLDWIPGLGPQPNPLSVPIIELGSMLYAGNIQLKLNGQFVYFYHPGEGQVGGAQGAGAEHNYLTLPDGLPENLKGRSFLDDDFNKTFYAQIGNYTGNTRGYWLRRGWANAEGYWVWQPQADTTIQFWNQDTRAAGPPQDLEMFYFEIVNANLQTVKIKNLYHGYVKYHEGKLHVGASVADADVFSVVFR